MSDKSAVQRFSPKVAAAPASLFAITDSETADDLGAFGWMRGVKDFARMIELRKRDGNILAVGYGYLDHAAFNPSEGITLSVAGRTIKIKGRNLNAEVRPTVRLFEGITRHRVSWIREADQQESMTADDETTVIDAITW
jgi:hypothetical protein